MKINYRSIFRKQLQFLKNITLFQALLIMSALLICFAATDVITKIIRLNKYDTERLIADIQSNYPNSELTVQNIKVVDNFMKKGTGRGEDYYDSNYFYIKDNQLHKEPSYWWLLFFVPPFIVLSMFKDPRNLKLKDINTVSDTAWLSALAVFFLFLIVMGFFYWLGGDGEYVYGASTGNFDSKSQWFMSTIDLDNYLKPVEK